MIVEEREKARKGEGAESGGGGQGERVTERRETGPLKIGQGS